jgi:hypothetical protein
VGIETLGQLLSVTAVAALLGVPVPTLEAWRRLRIGPPVLRIGSQYRYLPSELTAWVEDGGALDHGIFLHVLPGVADDAPLPVHVDGHLEQLGA